MTADDLRNVLVALVEEGLKGADEDAVENWLLAEGIDRDAVMWLRQAFTATALRNIIREGVPIDSALAATASMGFQAGWEAHKRAKAEVLQ